MAAVADCRVHTAAFMIKVNGTGCCGAAWGQMERAGLTGILSTESCRLLMEGSCCSLYPRLHPAFPPFYLLALSVNACAALLYLPFSQDSSRRRSSFQYTPNSTCKSQFEHKDRGLLWKKFPKVLLVIVIVNFVLQTNQVTKVLLDPLANIPPWLTSFHQGLDVVKNYCHTWIFHILWVKPLKKSIAVMCESDSSLKR